MEQLSPALNAIVTARSQCVHAWQGRRLRRGGRERRRWRGEDERGAGRRRTALATLDGGVTAWIERGRIGDARRWTALWAGCRSAVTSGDKGPWGENSLPRRSWSATY
jgi:hypothetical protein